VTTRPRLASRARSRRLSVDDLGLAFQMAFIADWTSPNTPVAVTISTTMPAIVATMPASRLSALLIISSRALAVCSPISPLNWPTMAPWAASRPNTSPAIATMISRTGAIENSV
jgi:hypothetical protein